MTSPRSTNSGDSLLSRLTQDVEAVRLDDNAVRDLMSKELRSCQPTDTLRHAAKIMWDHRCGSVPIVDDDGRPVAMLTDRDICMAAYTQGKTLESIPVSTAMSSQIFVVGIDDGLRAAERTMRCRSVRRLPVVDGERRLIGLLSLSDIAATAHLASSPGPGPLSADAVARTTAAVGHSHR